MFCVECGAEGEVYDGLCRECYIKRRKFIELPENIDLVLCSHCHSMKVGSRWDKVDDPISKAIDGALKVEKDVDISVDTQVQEEDERNFKVLLMLDIRTRGIELTETKETRVRVKAGVCQDCSRQRGSYYEAIVQLRAKRREPTEEEIEEALSLAENIVESSSSFITKVDHVKGGVDIYLGRTSDGRALAAMLSNRTGGRTGETKSQAGRKDGKDIFRTTFLVRLPQFGRGDFVVIDGAIWEIRSFTKNKANLEEVSSGRRNALPMKDLERLPILIRGDVLMDAVLVSISEKDVQVLDPESYRTVDLKRHPGMDDTAKEVKVVKYDGDLFLYSLIEQRQ
jgi:nonsense-mediated mRNA decay protein 3